MTFINPRAKVLRHLDRLAGWDVGLRPAPVTVEWDLSNRCSLGCKDCHFAHTHSRGPWAKQPRTLPMAFEATGDLADPALVRRALVQMAQSGVKAIIWSGGGEPTLHPEWMDLVRAAGHEFLKQGMYTLGGHFTAESASFLSHTADFVVVSLDAIDSKSYASEKGVHSSRFAAALNGITWLTGQRAVIGVSYLLHAGNWTLARAMVDLSRQLGANYTTLRPAIQFAPDRPSVVTTDRGWITDALPLLDELSRESDVEVEPARFAAYRDWQGHGYSACKGVRLNTTITPDGRVWLCPQRRGVGKAIGDLRTESFGAIWARHPGQFQVDDGCRVMCRLHPVNETLATLAQPIAHEAFV